MLTLHDFVAWIALLDMVQGASHQVPTITCVVTQSYPARLSLARHLLTTPVSLTFTCRVTCGLYCTMFCTFSPTFQHMWRGMWIGGLYDYARFIAQQGRNQDKEEYHHENFHGEMLSLLLHLQPRHLAPSKDNEEREEWPLIVHLAYMADISGVTTPSLSAINKGELLQATTCTSLRVLFVKYGWNTGSEAGKRRTFSVSNALCLGSEIFQDTQLRS